MSWAGDADASPDGTRRTKTQPGRRSRLEMTCDVLEVISQGVEKPTRIMQISNITWKDLLGYLETLLRNQFIDRDVNGSRVSYTLTEKGQSVLKLYLQLKEETSALELQRRAPEPVRDLPDGEMANLEGTIRAISERLRGSGYVIEDGRVVGRSGQAHGFDLVARAPDNALHGYVIRESVSEEEMLGLFVSMLDTGIAIHASCRQEPTEAAKSLADRFSICLEH